MGGGGGVRRREDGMRAARSLQTQAVESAQGLKAPLCRT